MRVLDKLYSVLIKAFPRKSAGGAGGGHLHQHATTLWYVGYTVIV